MSIHYKLIVILTIILTLVTSCASAEPAATPVPPTPVPPTSIPPTPEPESSAVSPISPATAAQVQALHILGGHTGSVPGFVFLPDGKQLLSIDSDATVRTWNVEDGQEVHGPKEHQGPVYYAAFSSDGALLAAEGSGHAVMLWGMEGD